MLKDRKIKKKIIYCAVAVLLAAVVIFAAILMWRNGFFLPRWAEWERELVFYDISGDYEIRLQRKKLKVFYRENLIWSAPDEIKIQDAISCDIDNDRQEELILLCWKRGRYGIHRPFWIEQDDTGWSQHIFVYEMRPEAVQPQWMSSYIGQDVANMRAQKNKSGVNLLQLTAPDGQISSWRWDFWGFTRLP